MVKNGLDQLKGKEMKALMATMMIALAVCFTGCSGGDDADKPAVEEVEEAPAE
jgi:hypothetical protein